MGLDLHEIHPLFCGMVFILRGNGAKVCPQFVSNFLSIFEVKRVFSHWQPLPYGAACPTVSQLIDQLCKIGVLNGEGRELVVYREAARQFLQERSARKQK